MSQEGFAAKWLVEDYPALRVSGLDCLAKVPAGTRYSGTAEGITLSIETFGAPARGILVSGHSQGCPILHRSVLLNRTPCHVGGTRYWFLCPERNCGRRVGVLYMHPVTTVLACRECHGLAYSSTRTRSRKFDLLAELQVSNPQPCLLLRPI